jgi:hypothetical protein
MENNKVPKIILDAKLDERKESWKTKTKMDDMQEDIKKQELKDGEGKPKIDQNGWMSLGRLR